MAEISADRRHAVGDWPCERQLIPIAIGVCVVVVECGLPTPAPFQLAAERVAVLNIGPARVGRQHVTGSRVHRGRIDGPGFKVIAQGLQCLPKLGECLIGLGAVDRQSPNDACPFPYIQTRVQLIDPPVDQVGRLSWRIGAQ